MDSQSLLTSPEKGAAEEEMENEMSEKKRDEKIDSCDELSNRDVLTVQAEKQINAEGEQTIEKKRRSEMENGGMEHKRSKVEEDEGQQQQQQEEHDDFELAELPAYQGPPQGVAPRFTLPPEWKEMYNEGFLDGKGYDLTDMRMAKKRGSAVQYYPVYKKAEGKKK